MKVFISWSGALSHAIALLLRQWLPDVIQKVDPYVSSEDIRKGNRWNLEVAKQLGETQYGIVCLTPDNLKAPWILFEAGALSKSLESSLTWTLLIGGLSPADIEGPLAQFQHTTSEKQDFKRLIDTINDVLADDKLEQERLNRIFERCWPEFEQKLQAIIQEKPLVEQVNLHRPEREILEEVLELSRNTSRSVAGYEAQDFFSSIPKNGYHTRLTIVPDLDHEGANQFLKACEVSPIVRRSRIISLGSGGTEGAIEHLSIQSRSPISKLELLRIAEEQGIEVVDVAYWKVPKK